MPHKKIHSATEAYYTA
uniref:Uncharacterized protein n=1 Tax=Arundo donax TaxID=35708 RepID=A0A0A9BK99_ARUDO